MAEDVIREIPNGPERPENSQYPEQTKRSAKTEILERRNAREKIDPTPFHELKFALRPVKADAEIDQEDHADKIIDQGKQSRQFRIEFEECVNDQSDKDID
jgi:hypothetical protein